MSLFGTDGPECGGNLSSAELQVVQRSERGIRPRDVRKQDTFSAGSRMIFTLESDSLHLLSSPRVAVVEPLGSSRRA